MESGLVESCAHAWRLLPRNIATLLIDRCCPLSTAKPLLGQPRKIGEGCRFNSFTTNNYKLHFYETPSGIKVWLG